MESQQRFQLRRNGHNADLAHDFEDLRQQGEFVDVTLACEGHTLKGHKVVLSSCSSYLRRVLRDNPCQHPIVILKDVKFADMEVLVKFMYNGEADVTRKQLNTILDLADTLEVKGLAEVVKEHERMQHPLGVEGGRLPLADLSYCPGNLWPEMQDRTTTSNSSPKRHKVSHIRSIQEQSAGGWGIGEQPATFTGNRDTLPKAACVSQEHQGGSENDVSSLSERFSVKIERLSPCEFLENDQRSSSEMPFPPQSSSREAFGWGSFDEDIAGSSDVNPALSMPAKDNLWPEMQNRTTTSNSSPEMLKVTQVRSIHEQPEGVWGIREQPATFTGYHGTSQTAACVSQQHQGGSENDSSSLSERLSVKIERLSPCEVLETDQPTSSEMPFPPQSFSREAFGWGSFAEDVAGSSDVSPALPMPAKESKVTKKVKKLTIAQQYGESVLELAKEYEVVPCTISKTKGRETTVPAFQFNTFLKKRIADSSVKQVEKALYLWILEQKALDNPISGSILKAKALELNEQLNECSKFKASDSWLYKFKRRYKVSYKA